uniref:Uncharacterized protein n=1 Tax=Cacopsylla melanoneura TaxID=428564 RepID=A0A8D8U5H0_9HEMI
MTMTTTEVDTTATTTEADTTTTDSVVVTTVTTVIMLLEPTTMTTIEEVAPAPADVITVRRAMKEDTDNLREDLTLVEVANTPLATWVLRSYQTIGFDEKKLQGGKIPSFCETLHLIPAGPERFI